MQLTRILTAAVTAAFLSTPVSAQLELFGGAASGKFKPRPGPQRTNQTTIRRVRHRVNSHPGCF